MNNVNQNTNSRGWHAHGAIGTNKHDLYMIMVKLEVYQICIVQKSYTEHIKYVFSSNVP